jgi:CRISPR-associated protein Cmr6
MSREARDVLRCKALNEYLVPEILSTSNVISAFSRALIECFLECIEHQCGVSSLERFTSLFSKEASERLKRAYSCPAVRNLLEESHKRVTEAYARAREIFGAAFLLVGKLQSRMLIHSKSPTLPLDISLAWDPTLNIPYIPSSSVKGVVRTYFEVFNVDVDGLMVSDIFGDQERVGYVIFLDAYPVTCEKTLIDVDVITPHYVESAGQIDETSVRPTPIVFPTIAPGTTIYFPIAIDVRRVEETVSESKLRKLREKTTLDKLIDNIMKALETGIGAKTSLGYGYIKITKA